MGACLYVCVCVCVCVCVYMRLCVLACSFFSLMADHKSHLFLLSSSSSTSLGCYPSILFSSAPPLSSPLSSSPLLSSPLLSILLSSLRYLLYAFVFKCAYVCVCVYICVCVCWHALFFHSWLTTNPTSSFFHLRLPLLSLLLSLLRYLLYAFVFKCFIFSQTVQD